MKKILLAEDDKPIATALELKLSSSGYSITVAENGKIAYELASKEKFDLVLLDLIMPVMDGFEVLEHLKKDKYKTPIIVLSNLGQDEDRKRAKELGAKDYFIKSDIDLSQIIEYIQKYLK